MYNVTNLIDSSFMPINQFMILNEGFSTFGKNNNFRVSPKNSENGKLLLQFPTTFLYETEFFDYLFIKSKCSTRLDEEDENPKNSRSCKTKTRSIFAVMLTW
ncbi:hypothetical protein RF11_05062 [Thelohanellus kitauei]|uniref:Uncharacterized protein n=1 Tax=Thelohanellus kitauei TaxID=669202 RepID=A0A0C2MIJ3_THEKT|nr:hypothetical protein RF11_05062 [Thelohanellus kitauei]